MNLEVPEMSPEAELILLCAKPGVDAESRKRLDELLGTGLNWGYLIKSARDHRVVPLLYRALLMSQELIPDHVLEELQRSNLVNGRRNISLSSELLNIVDRLENQDIPILPFKGPLLASSAYGDLFLRQFDDLDILIPEEKIAEAESLLASMGYTAGRQELSKAQKAALLKYQHHHHLYHQVTKIHLEVHWRLSPQLYSLEQDTSNLWSRARPASLMGRSVKSLSLEDSLVLICDHSARHQWSRLSWICDVSMLLRLENLNWQIVTEQAEQWRAKRALLLGLLLANGLLNAPLPADMAERIANDGAARALASQAIARLFPGGKASEEAISDPAQRDIQEQLFYIKCRESFLDRSRLFFRIVTTPTVEDWKFLPLPEPLFPFYYLIRPLRQANAYRLKILRRFWE